MQFSTSDEPIPGPTLSAHAEPTSKAMARSDITSVEAIVVKLRVKAMYTCEPRESSRLPTSSANQHT